MDNFTDAEKRQALQSSGFHPTKEVTTCPPIYYSVATFSVFRTLQNFPLLMFIGIPSTCMIFHIYKSEILNVPKLKDLKS